MGRKINRKVELLSPEQLLKRGGKLLPIILDPPGMKAPGVAALVQGHASCRQSMPPTMLRRGRQWLSNYSSSALRSIATELRLRNDLYCVEWGVKLYSLTHSSRPKKHTVMRGDCWRRRSPGDCNGSRGRRESDRRQAVSSNRPAGGCVVRSAEIGSS